MLRFKTCDRGATAIEYAIIAGLIGIGLIGSLVTTRGSLASIFGVASSQMASAGTDSSGSAQSAVAAYWSKKTISTTSVDGSGIRTIVYTDGSSASVQSNRAAPYNTFFSTRDYASGQGIDYAADASKNTTSYYMWSFSNIASNIVSGLERANVESFSNGTPQSTTKETYNASGVKTGQTTGVPSQAYVNSLPAAQDTLRYFLDLDTSLKAQGR